MRGRVAKSFPDFASPNPAAADAETSDELLAKITAMTLDLLPDNHPNVDPSSVYLQITALREAEPVAV